LRTRAYQAVLSGAAGQVFGNNPIWHFDGPGLYTAPVTWKEALTSDGSKGMSYMRKILEKIPWWRLVPNDGFLVPVSGTGDEKVVAARDINGHFALVYIPDGQKVTLRLNLMRQKWVHARWFDPAEGILHRPIGNIALPTSQVRSFVPPAENGAGDRDWVLFLKTVQHGPGAHSGQIGPLNAIGTGSTL
jgi:hypothetical protein